MIIKILNIFEIFFKNTNFNQIEIKISIHIFNSNIFENINEQRETGKDLRHQKEHFQ